MTALRLVFMMPWGGAESKYGRPPLLRQMNVSVGNASRINWEYSDNTISL